MSRYTARYMAYCAAHGHPNDPEGMLAADRIRWPGGVMTGFILWNSEQWEAWAKERGEMPAVKSAEHHADYDAWLTKSVTPVTARRPPTR